jgi:hypothetical protein
MEILESSVYEQLKRHSLTLKELQNLNPKVPKSAIEGVLKKLLQDGKITKRHEEKKVLFMYKMNWGEV